MTVTLHRKGYEHAKKLIEQGRLTRDELDDWSEAAPTADRENTYLERNGYQQYGDWFLGLRDDESEETKGRYAFPFGDFTRVHRSGLIAAEVRAAQNDYDDIAKAARRLLDLIDAQ
jgi:hypothetical protein